MSGQLHAPASLPREKDPESHCIGGCVDPWAGLENVQKITFLTLLGLELRPLGRPACSQLLYRLRYSGSTEHTELFT
jgi:hypothetical protein